MDITLLAGQVQEEASGIGNLINDITQQCLSRHIEKRRGEMANFKRPLSPIHKAT